jgi:MFS family permease
MPKRGLVVTVVGLCQIFAWGSSYYLPAVLADPIARDTGWPLAWVLGGLSIGLLVSGLVSPFAGRAIERVGGRPVLATSAVLLAAGLLALALAPTLAAYAGAWIVIGLGMGAGLYDPAFSTLGHLYGEEARPLITGVTLWGGFASTVCWPLSALLAAHLGWRGACAVYAALQLGMVLPLYLFGLPRPAAAPRPPQPKPVGAPVARGTPFWLTAIAMTFAALVMTIISVELPTLLRARGADATAAVALGTLLGPAQVGARAIEFVVGRRGHPVWTMLAATVLVAIGLAALLLDRAFFALAVIIYGAGGGIRSIARGTLPLALFGREGYPTVMGRLAMPSLIAQAASPVLGGAMLSGLGADTMLLAVLALAGANTVPVLLLIPYARTGARSGARAGGAEPG